MTKCSVPCLGFCLFAGGIARFPSVDVVLSLEDFRDGVFDGAGLLKGKEVFAVPEYICLPDDVVRGEGETAAVLEEDPVERDDAAAAVVLPDLPEALEREEGDDAQEDGARLLL